MKQKILTGLTIGSFAGIVDLIPMFIQHLPWQADASAFSMWVVIGFLLSVTVLPLKGVIKGLILSFLVLLPTVFIIAGNEPLSLIPICIMTALLGSASGYTYQRLVQ